MSDWHSEREQRFSTSGTPPKDPLTPIVNLVLENGGETAMFLTLTAICVVALCLLIVIWIKRTRDRRNLELHSITPEALHTLLISNKRCFSSMFASRSTC